MRVLASPSKIANALDWRRSTGGAIATLDIHADRIGVRISQHPKNTPSRKRPLQHYSSLPVSPRGRTKIPESTRQQLSELVHQHKVCGFVVFWPLQQDTGLMGAACGRTLYAIEELLQDDVRSSSSTTTTSRPVFAPNRPFCLWDVGTAPAPTADAFGRSPLYARTSKKTKHVASIEQYHHDESLESSGIWENFVRIHWPDIDPTRTSDPEHHLASLWGNENSRAENGENEPGFTRSTTIWNGGGAGSALKRRTQAAL